MYNYILQLDSLARPLHSHIGGCFSYYCPFPLQLARGHHISSLKDALKQRMLQAVVENVVQGAMLSLAFGSIHDGLFWVLFFRIYIDWILFILKIVALFTGEDVRNLPPDFGSFGQASTISGFWGGFWHQNLRFAFTSVSNHFCKRVLRLHGRVQRCADILVVSTVWPGARAMSNSWVTTLATS